MADNCDCPMCRARRKLSGIAYAKAADRDDQPNVDTEGMFICAATPDGGLEVAVLHSTHESVTDCAINIHQSITSCKGDGAAFMAIQRGKVVAFYAPAGFNLTPAELARRAGLVLKEA